MKEQDTALARVAALKAMPTAELTEQWQALFDTSPPPYNRRLCFSIEAGPAWNSRMVLILLTKP